MMRENDLPPGVSFRSIGEGKVGALIQAKDWSQTAFGPIGSWPYTLQGHVSMILNLPTPAIIFWGPDLLQIYNDGYAVIMGPRHPQYLGAPYKECWPDTYPTIFPWMQRVLNHGEVVEVDRTLIPVTRYGFNEEAFFTFSFSPLKNDRGKVAGILQIVTEMTGTVLAERRLQTLRALAPDLNSDSIAIGELNSKGHSYDVSQAIIETLATNPHDIRFALLFLPLLDHELALVRSFGIDKSLLENLEFDPILPLAKEVFLLKTAKDIPDVQQLLPHLPIGPWPELTQKALALPLKRSDAEHPRGVILLGISPRLSFDPKYFDFFQSVAREIAFTLAAEEEKLGLLEIAKERERLFSVFQQAPVAICVVEGPSHIFMLANPTYLAFFGGDRDVLGKSVREALPEIEGQGYFEILDQVYQTGETYFATEAPVSVTQFDGSIKQLYVNFIYQPKRDAKGRVNGIVAVVIDVTEQVLSRKKIEDIASELRYQSRLTQTITENAASCLFMMDKQGHPTFMNPAAERVTGHKLHEIKDRPLHLSVHHTKPDGSFYPLEECPIDSAQLKLKAVHNQEEIFIDKNGRFFPVSFSISPLENNGEVIGSVLEFRDITLEKRRQKQLAMLAETSLLINSQSTLQEKIQLITDKARSLIEAHQAVISVMADQQKRPQSMNAVSLSDKYAQWIHTTKPANEKPENFAVSTYLCPLQKPIKLTQEELERHPMWKEIRKHKDKHPPLRGWLGVPMIGSDGKNIGFIQLSDKCEGDFTAEDESVIIQLAQVASAAIENAELLEREKAAVKIRDEFLSIASHELKTPITSLKLQLQITKRGIKPERNIVPSAEKLDKMLEISTRQIDRLTALVDELLDVSRIGAGKLTFNFEQVELTDLVQEISERHSEQLRVAGCSLEILVPEKIMVYCDPFRIEQVITNLLSNAAKYGSGKPIHLLIGKKNNFAKISVQDFGMGIQKEKQEQIFERFERAVNHVNISGLGLGLYISREIVRAHQGHLSVESELNQGSTFTVELPLVTKV